MPPTGNRPTPAECSVKADQIVAACEARWEANKANCSGFVRAVAADLGIGLSGQANDIVDFIAANWWPIADGVAARDWAEAGYLVVGGLKAAGNGHVVVVVPGPLAHGKYPTAYWGKLNGVGKKKTTLNFAWTAADRDDVAYYGALIHVATPG